MLDFWKATGHPSEALAFHASLGQEWICKHPRRRRWVVKPIEFHCHSDIVLWYPRNVKVEYSLETVSEWFIYEIWIDMAAVWSPMLTVETMEPGWTAQENHVIVGTDSDLFRGDCWCLRMFVVRLLSVSYLFATWVRDSLWIAQSVIGVTRCSLCKVLASVFLDWSLTICCPKYRHEMAWNNVLVIVDNWRIHFYPSPAGALTPSHADVSTHTWYSWIFSNGLHPPDPILILLHSSHHPILYIHFHAEVLGPCSTFEWTPLSHRGPLRRIHWCARTQNSLVAR